MLIELTNNKNILIGKLGYISFPKAFYAYVGSAMNGLEARLAHHLRKTKRPHWHIDYLLSQSEIIDIILCPSEQKTECLLAHALANEFSFVPGFGCSDCRCNSHLYFASDGDKLAAKAIEAVEQVSPAYSIFPMEELEIGRI